MTFKKILFVSVIFLLMPMLGTLSHEFGHWVIAKWLDFKATIHYNYTSVECNCLTRNESGHFLTMHNTKSVYISAVGIASTVLIGSLSFYLHLINSSNNFYKIVLLFGLSLFWSREIVVALTTILHWGEPLKIVDLVDEGKVGFLMLGNVYVVPIVLGCISICICTFSVLQASKKTHASKLMLLVSTSPSVIAGYLLWNYLLGPVFLP